MSKTISERMGIVKSGPWKPVDNSWWHKQAQPQTPEQEAKTIKTIQREVKKLYKAAKEK